MPGPWLAKVRRLLGEIPDHEVARRAGVAQSLVTVARNRLGIPAYRSRTLASYAPDEVLRMVRARAKAGRQMRGAPIDDFRLANLCRYHFGGWYQAVAAAGLTPAGMPHRTRRTLPSPQTRALTQALLKGPRTSAELERLTGMSASGVRSRRKALGIVRDERQRPDRSWLPGVRRLLGKIPDSEIAERVGVSAPTVSAARSALGIARVPKRSRAANGEVRERLRQLSKLELRQAVAALDPVDAKIIEARYLGSHPVALAQLGRRLGISRQRVAQRERRAVAAMGASE